MVWVRTSHLRPHLSDDLDQRVPEPRDDIIGQIRGNPLAVSPPVNHRWLREHMTGLTVA